MIEAKIYERPDMCYARVIILLDESNVYDFKEDKWIKKEPHAVLPDNCQLLLSPEAYAAVARAIEEDKTLPKTQLSFTEGKLEATEKHLEDMRNLVFDDKEEK